MKTLREILENHHFSEMEIGEDEAFSRSIKRLKLHLKEKIVLEGKAKCYCISEYECGCGHEQYNQCRDETLKLIEGLE